MATFHAGKILQKRRGEMGITQAQLCDGLCDVSTLARIERGEVAPNNYLCQALFQRVGIDPTNYYINATSRDEIELESLFNAVHTALLRNDFELAEQNLNTIFNDYGSFLEKPIIMQRYLHYKTSVFRGQGKPTSERIPLILQALSISFKDFSIERIRERPLTYVEIALLNGLAIANESDGQRDTAIKIYYEIKSSIERFSAHGLDKPKGYCMTLSNLSSKLGLSGRYAEAEEVCDIGIAHARSENQMTMLPTLLFNKACCLFFLNKDPEYKELVQQAFWMAKAQGDKRTAEEIKCYSAKELGYIL